MMHVYALLLLIAGSVIFNEYFQIPLPHFLSRIVSDVFASIFSQSSFESTHDESTPSSSQTNNLCVNITQKDVPSILELYSKNIDSLCYTCHSWHVLE